MYKEERRALEEGMSKIDECDMEEDFGTKPSRGETIAFLGDNRWWPQAAKQEGDSTSQRGYHVRYLRNVISAQVLEVSLFGVGTVPNLDRDA